jgi:hypothetical protein
VLEKAMFSSQHSFFQQFQAIINYLKKLKISEAMAYFLVQMGNSGV